MDRSRLIAGGVCVWSLLTAASGFANSYAGLLVPRIFVGVGESVLAPCSLSLIPELFPPSLLAFASGCYLSAPHVGSGFAHILAGLTGNTLGWHASFWMMGGAGLLMGVSVPFLVRDPRQQAASLTLREAARKVRGSVRSSVGFVGGCPAIGYCIAGKFALGFTIGCHAMVQPWLTNERGFSREDADLAHGTLMLAIGVFSTPLVGFVADQFAQRTGKPKITLVAVQVAVFKLPVALCFFCLADPRSGSFWVLYACFVALQSVSAPVIATLQQLSPPTLRGSIIGLALLALYLPGMGMGNLVAGMVADHFTAAGSPYPYTIALASVYAIGCPLQAVSSLLCSPRPTPHPSLQPPPHSHFPTPTPHSTTLRPSAVVLFAGGVEVQSRSSGRKWRQHHEVDPCRRTGLGKLREGSILILLISGVLVTTCGFWVDDNTCVLLGRYAIYTHQSAKSRQPCSARLCSGPQRGLWEAS